MSIVASRDLRNHTADVLRQVAGGESVTVTVHGRPVAEIVPATSARSPYLTRSDLGVVLAHRADAGLRDDLAELAGQTTDELDPL